VTNGHIEKRQSHAHHYVPQWYQKRFLKKGQFKFHYLDLNPEVVVNERVRYRRRDLLFWGPSRCFCKDDLYTVNLRDWTSDEVETLFFGKIDNLGRKAVDLFGSYGGYTASVYELFSALSRYMGAQRFRTPRGLDYIEGLTSRRDRNLTLVTMQRLFLYNTTMWSEGTWEIVGAHRSPTKFIVSDEPVSFYNRKIYPSECVYPRDVPLELVGTRTLFPLGLETCLITTHTQLVRNPHLKANVPRVNARSFEQTMKYLLDTQFGRELEEDEVIRINLIMKKRAVRYIAAAEEEWLYPEKRASTTNWSQLDDDWFLLPNLYKVPFSGGILAGNDKGPVWAQDEHGRHPGNPGYKDKKLHDREWEAHQRTKLEWAQKRVGRSVAHVDGFRENRASDTVMQEDLGKMKKPDGLG
jgi:hypothetical protein